MKRCIPLLALFLGCSQGPAVHAQEGARQEGSQTPSRISGTQLAAAVPEGRASAVFAGGCFWCMETAFEPLEGVDSVESGYTGGPEEHPSYRAVSHHRTGHLEAVRVVYDPEVISYQALLRVFWRNVDPTQDNGQFCDRGNQYRTALFVASDSERRQAETSRSWAAERLGERIVTRILPAADFWVAEDYHQDYYRKNPGHYRAYRRGCGRDARLQALWGDEAPRAH